MDSWLTNGSRTLLYLYSKDWFNARTFQIVVVPSKFFSALQSYCSRLSVGLLSCDSRSTLVQLDRRKKIGQLSYKKSPGLTLFCRVVTILHACCGWGTLAAGQGKHACHGYCSLSCAFNQYLYSIRIQTQQEGCQTGGKTLNQSQILQKRVFGIIYTIALTILFHTRQKRSYFGENQLNKNSMANLKQLNFLLGQHTKWKSPANYTQSWQKYAPYSSIFQKKKNICLQISIILTCVTTN